MEDLNAQVTRTEHDLAIIKEYLMTRMRADEKTRLNSQFVAECLGLTPTEGRVALLLPGCTTAAPQPYFLVLPGRPPPSTRCR